MKKRSPSDLISSLFPEAFQAEESARAHPRREAERLGPVGPGVAMTAIARHADAGVQRLQELAKKRGLQTKSFGRGIGRALSHMREYAIDRVVSHETSYRGTLGGIQHGIGVMAFLEDAAIASGDQELADFCGEWLVARRELAATVEHELAWFAQNPDVAMSRATKKNGKPTNLVEARA